MAVRESTGEVTELQSLANLMQETTAILKSKKNTEAFRYFMPNKEGEGGQPTGTAGMLTRSEQILQTRYFKYAEICRKKLR